MRTASKSVFLFIVVLTSTTEILCDPIPSQDQETATTTSSKVKDETEDLSVVTITQIVNSTDVENVTETVEVSNVEAVNPTETSNKTDDLFTEIVERPDEDLSTTTPAKVECSTPPKKSSRKPPKITISLTQAIEDKLKKNETLTWKSVILGTGSDAVLHILKTKIPKSQTLGDEFEASLQRLLTNVVNRRARIFGESNEEGDHVIKVVIFDD